ncbi:MAG: branched-chain amino acid ABC transporter permease [Gammaproteobacteria bacterium]|nr:branched-chain amino acid ABC transporter permease [Gammaproteobacteria bacterium]NIR85278.1 branched-chain amino acid ABC transporter permease [Gammaproteobacteria bacterium]NIR88394.1 branched-chain amino acid ABC transporter permease [Gammaproteobacteria bacterium]NIU06344.1 branched-chain amino acid ABC transporter permease [Gammaproteobacteria bacterium]NIV53243.1 branched-chain amino acid ABC transporter permease [Gammaproteobacteria bacterium]
MIQVVFDSLIRASELALLALGLTMVYSVLRFPNFSHVEFAPIGGYIALLLSSTLGFNLYVAGALAVVAAGLIGVGCDRLVFAKLRERSPIMLMIAAFALGIALRETIRAAWGPSPFFFELGLQRPMTVLGAHLTPVQLTIIVTAFACMLGFHLLLNHTKLGIAMRAAADNSELAQASGIYTERVIRAVWFIGGAFAALGGILIGLDTQLQPDMGFGIIIPVFCAAILGGIGHPYGAMLGALVLGFAENIGLSIDWGALASLTGLVSVEHVYISTGYKEGIPFAILILVLLLRPQGLAGGRRR